MNDWILARSLPEVTMNESTPRDQRNRTLSLSKHLVAPYRDGHGQPKDWTEELELKLEV